MTRWDASRRLASLHSRLLVLVASSPVVAAGQAPSVVACLRAALLSAAAATGLLMPLVVATTADSARFPEAASARHQLWDPSPGLAYRHSLLIRWPLRSAPLRPAFLLGRLLRQVQRPATLGCGPRLLLRRRARACLGSLDMASQQPKLLRTTVLVRRRLRS